MNQMLVTICAVSSSARHAALYKAGLSCTCVLQVLPSARADIWSNRLHSRHRRVVGGVCHGRAPSGQTHLSRCALHIICHCACPFSPANPLSLPPLPTPPPLCFIARPACFSSNPSSAPSTVHACNPPLLPVLLFLCQWPLLMHLQTVLWKILIWKLSPETKQSGIRDNIVVYLLCLPTQQ